MPPSPAPAAAPLAATAAVTADKSRSKRTLSSGKAPSRALPPPPMLPATAIALGSRMYAAAYQSGRLAAMTSVRSTPGRRADHSTEGCSWPELPISTSHFHQYQRQHCENAEEGALVSVSTPPPPAPRPNGQGEPGTHEQEGLNMIKSGARLSDQLQTVSKVVHSTDQAIITVLAKLLDIGEVKALVEKLGPAIEKQEYKPPEEVGKLLHEILTQVNKALRALASSEKEIPHWAQGLLALIKDVQSVLSLMTSTVKDVPVHFTAQQQQNISAVARDLIQPALEKMGDQLADGLRSVELAFDEVRGLLPSSSLSPSVSDPRRQVSDLTDQVRTVVQEEMKHLSQQQKQQSNEENRKEEEHRAFITKLVKDQSQSQIQALQQVLKEDQNTQEAQEARLIPQIQKEQNTAQLLTQFQAQLRSQVQEQFHDLFNRVKEEVQYLRKSQAQTQLQMDTLAQHTREEMQQMTHQMQQAARSATQEAVCQAIPGCVQKGVHEAVPQLVQAWESSVTTSHLVEQAATVFNPYLDKLAGQTHALVGMVSHNNIATSDRTNTNRPCFTSSTSQNFPTPFSHPQLTEGASTVEGGELKLATLTAPTPVTSTPIMQRQALPPSVRFQKATTEALHSALPQPGFAPDQLKTESSQPNWSREDSPFAELEETREGHDRILGLSGNHPIVLSPSNYGFSQSATARKVERGLGRSSKSDLPSTTKLCKTGRTHGARKQAAAREREKPVIGSAAKCDVHVNSSNKTGKRKRTCTVASKDGTNTGKELGGTKDLRTNQSMGIGKREGPRVGSGAGSKKSCT